MLNLAMLYKTSSASRWTERAQEAANQAKTSPSRSHRMTKRWTVGVYQGAVLSTRAVSPLPWLLGTGSLPFAANKSAAQSRLPTRTMPEAPPGWLNQKLVNGLELCTRPTVRKLAGAAAALCSILAGLLALAVHGVAVVIGLVVGSLYGVMLALGLVNIPLGLLLELAPRSARPSRPMPSLFLFTRFTQSDAEEELVGSLLAVRGVMPPQEFFETLFAGLPRKPKLDVQASELKLMVTSLLQNIEVKHWYYRMEQLNFARSVSRFLELVLEAHKIQAHSIDVFNLLQENLSAIIGVTDSSQVLIAQLKALRIRSHPDKFSQSLARFSEESCRLKLRMETVFKSLGQLLELVQQDPKFAERLCCKPV